MSQAPRQSRGGRPIRTAASVFRMSDRTFTRIYPDGLRRVATASVLKCVIDLGCHSTSKYVSTS